MRSGHMCASDGKAGSLTKQPKQQFSEEKIPLMTDNGLTEESCEGARSPVFRTQREILKGRIQLCKVR